MNLNVQQRSPPIVDSIMTNPVRINYNFTKIKDIQSLPIDKVVDILAWVRQTHDLVQFTSRAGQDYKKRELQISVAAQIFP